MSRSQAEKHSDTGCLKLPKRFDIMSTLDCRAPFVRLLINADVKRLVVNLSDVSYIDSMGIGMLISWDRSCREKDKALVLERCDSHVMKMLRYAGVDRLFEYA